MRSYVGRDAVVPAAVHVDGDDVHFPGRPAPLVEKRNVIRELGHGDGPGGVESAGDATKPGVDFSGVAEERIGFVADAHMMTAGLLRSRSIISAISRWR